MSYIPNISGFVDFCGYHANKEPIYIVNGKLYATLDMCCHISDRYNFTNSRVKEEVEQAIKDNIYMFDIEKTNKFYCSNDNMFSMSNAQYHIKGEVLTLKRKYISKCK